MGRTVLAFAAASALGVMACAPSVKVKTAAAPDAGPAVNSAHTFHFLRMKSTETSPLQQNDPMLENSITGRAVRQDIEQELAQRGLQHVRDSAADLSVAYYVGSQNKLRVTDYDYGYRFWGWRGWRWGPGWGGLPEQQVTQYEQGTVIIDVLDSEGKKLLWRGVGQSDLSSDANAYAKEIAKAVHSVLAKFPRGASAAT